MKQSAQAPQYLAPAVRCVESIASQAKLAHTLQSATIALANQKPLLQVAKLIAVTSKVDAEPFNQLLKRQESLEIWANEVLSQHHHATNLPALLNIWAAIEALVEDTSTLILQYEESAVEALSSAGIKTGKTHPRTEDEARALYEKSLLFFKKDGLVNGFISLLHCIGLHLGIGKDVIDSLRELNYIRNCTLHRNGVVEFRVRKEAPTLVNPIGTPIVIDSMLFLKYYDACSEFAKAIIPAIGNSQYMKSSLAS